MLTEQQVRDIATEVFQNLSNQSQFNVANVPIHTHNGTDSPQLSQANVLPYFRANGTITMATDGQDYTLGVNFNCSRVDFNGVAVHKTAGTIDKRALVNGVAFLGASYDFRTQSSNSVIVGGPVEPLIQGCSSLTIDAAATPPYAVNTSEVHIVQVVQPGTGTDVAVATISTYSKSFVKVHVALTAGWSIIGTFAVS